MPSSTKRALTDETRNSILASNSPSHSSTSPDIAASLRNIGSRIRKNASLDVTEGYTTHNSSYTKAHSTGNIFRSANDTLRDIFPSGPSVTALHPSELKRTHTQSEQEYDSDGGAVHDDDTKMHLIIPKYDQASMGFNRPIKALRKPRRTMLTTRSLPGDSFGFGNSVETFMGGGALKELEEEDWSIPTIQPESSSHITPESSDNDQPSQVEPMILT